MSSLYCAGIFLEMSNPTTKWNSSISFLGQYKAEPQSSGVGVGHDSGY